MAVTNNFSASSLDLNGKITISQPTALVWGPDGRLYVTEVDGDVKVLTVGFGDKDPDDDDATAQFFVTDATTLSAVKNINNYNDDGTDVGAGKRQVTGIDVTQQFDADGEPVLIDGKPAVTIYVTSSDSRIGAGPDGDDSGLDTNSGVITRLTQEDGESWAAVDIVRGFARSEENHALNGLEVIQELDGDGNLVSERLIVANGGNANTGAPSNNFAGQQEQPLSAALLEVDLDALKALDVQTDAKGRSFIYDLPTLDDPTRSGGAENDPFGGNDGINSAKLLADGPVRIYSPGYRNAYDVEVTDDGRVFTYDNGANNSWGGRPIGEAGDSGGKNAIDFAQAAGYIALNLNNGEGNGNDPINLENWDPSNKDQLHEATRSDDLGGRTLSAGKGGAQTYTDPAGSGLTLVYGGHPNPTRAEGSRAGILFSPKAGAEDAFLLVSNEDSFGDGGASDYDEVIAWLTEVENDDANFPSDGIYGAEPGSLTSRVLAVEPGVEYDIYAFSDGRGAAVVAGAAVPTREVGGSTEAGELLGQGGLPADIAEIVAYKNPVEGDYLEAGKTDGALDTGNGSINGLTEYTSTVLDEGDVKMSGALISSSLGGSLIVIGREADGTVDTKVNGQGFTVASDRTVIDAGGSPLGLASIGDDFADRGLSGAFQGSVWSAVYGQNGPLIEIFQPGNGAVPLAGSEVVDPTDFDGDGVDHVADPFEFSPENGYALSVGQSLELDFSPLNDNFPTSFRSTGLLGASLDGETPNRDARTAAENFPVDQQRDGLFDNEGNLIPGGNAPIFQIKEVVDGTVVGAANSARDAVHTGFRPDDDVQRVVATIDAKNWLPAVGTPQTGQLTGMMFGDGTQSNFLRVVFGGVEGFASGLEVGFEVDDVYTVLSRIALPELLTPPAAPEGEPQPDPAPTAIELRLEVGDIGGGFDVGVSYRLEGRSGFTQVPLDGGAGFSLPAGVLRDVLTGDHTIGTGANEQVSGAAVGLLAEDVPGGDLAAIDFNQIVIRAFGNEIVATTPAEVATSGSSGIDTVIYTGTATNLPQLAPNVENFDGRGSQADYNVAANGLDNVIRVGTGENAIATGGGSDVVRGTLEQLAGDEIVDFSADDAVVVEGVDADEASIGFSAGPAGSAIVTVEGQEITFSGPEFAGFQAGDGSAIFRIENADGGLRITLAPDEEVVYRVNAGSVGGVDAGQGTIAATDGGPDWIGDGGLVGGSGPVSLTGATANTYGIDATDTAAEVTYTDGVDQGATPWQLFVNERSDNSQFGPKLTYQFDVDVGATYRIDVFYTENWDGIFAFSETPGNVREFDIAVEGEVPTAFEDLNPAVEAAAALGIPVPGGNASAAAKGEILGTALVRSHTYEAGDGTLSLEFEHGVQNPKVNAIQVTRLGAQPADVGAPEIVSIEVENPQNVQDDAREATIVLRDDRGFEAATLEALDGSELDFTGIVPTEISKPTVSLSEGGLVATLNYTLTPPDVGWPRGEGTVSIAAGAYQDAAGNPSEAATGAFIFEPDLDGLVAGEVALAINVGPVANTTDPTLTGDDKNTYGGAIDLDPIIGVPLEADDPTYYTPSSKTESNIDGKPGSNGETAALDGSALHTFRDSADGSFTATYPVENGVYVVDLWFAELFHAQAGSRQGDYVINGETVELDFDAFAEAGPDTPVKISKTVVVTDGQLVVDVNADAGQPGYNAIVVYDAVQGTGPATVSVAGTSAIEGQDAVIVLNRAGDASEDVEVTLSLAPGSADATDYAVPIDTTVTIPAGLRQATFSVPILDDAQEEEAESFTVTIDSVSDGAAIGTATATVTIGASDVSSNLPLGGAVFDLGFDTSGDPFGPGGLDAVLGGTGALVAAQATVAGGKLQVVTSNGDLTQGDPTASKNDFVKAADVSSSDIEEVYLTTRFDNPFDGETVENYLQQGLVIATGDPATNQNAGQSIKLIFGGNGGPAIQLASQGGPTPVTSLEAISDAAVAAGSEDDAFGLADVASVELGLGVDKVAGTYEAWVTLFDEAGGILGGVRPAAAPGFAVQAPLALPGAVAAAIGDGTSVFGVTSNDFGPAGAFTATWDSLTLSSPQVSGEEPSGDAFQGIDAGDFSDDNLAPSDLGVLPVGEAVLQAGQEGPLGDEPRDYDYVTFTVAEGQQLDQIVVTDYETDGASNGGFFALIEGTEFPAPPTSFEENEAFAAQLLAGAIVPNEFPIGGDLLGDDGDGSIQGQATLDHDGPLGPGTYSLWFSQGGAPSTTTLTFQSSEVSVDPIISIAGAGSVVESGDDGVTALVFQLTASGALSGDVALTFTAAGVEETRTITFADGQAALSIDVPNDDADTGDTSVEVVLTGADVAEISADAATATGTVTEDDGTEPTPGAVVFALNVGGGAVTGTDGTAYEADTGAGWTGSQPYTDGGSGQPALAGGDYDRDGDADADDTPYATERFGGSGNGVMTYTRDGLAPGQYLLTLQLAELFDKNFVAGTRVFDVRANGETILDDHDATNFASEADEGYEVTVPVTVGADGTLELEFDASADNAKVNGLVLREAPSDGGASVSLENVEVVEGGDAVVTVTRMGDTTEALDVTLAVTDGTALAGEDYAAPGAVVVTIAAGETTGTATLTTLGDDVEEGSETLTVEITGTAPEATVVAGTATVTILDDDLPAGTAPGEDFDGDGIPNASDDDVDGDGVADEAETFRYDATNEGQALAAGQSVTLDFDVDGTPWQNGLTGALVSPKATVSEVDLANATVSGGTLDVVATQGDHFGGNNTQENAFVAGYKASEGLRVETSFAAPDFNPNDADAQTAPGNFQSAGVVIGTDQSSLVKAVFGRAGPGFQFSLDGGGGQTGTFPAGTDYAAVATVAVALEVFPVDGAVQAQGTVTLLDAGGATVAEIVSNTFPVTGALAAQVLAGDTLGAGVIQTSFGSGGPDFGVSYESLTVTALGTPSGDPVVSIADAPAVLEGDDGIAALVFALTTTGEDGDATVTYTVDDGDPIEEVVIFTGGAATLTVEVADDDVASGDATVAVALSSVEGATLGTATATGTVTEDDFAPAVDVGILAQSATPGEALDLAVPADAFADADSTLTLSATLADGTPLPAWLTFADGVFSGTPEAGDAGTLSIAVTAADGSNPDAVTTFDLVVGDADNTSPTAASIDAGVVEETSAPVVIDLLGGASDVDGDVLSVSGVSVVDGGGFEVAFTLEGATLTIDPSVLAEFIEEGESTTVTVSFEVTDGRGGVVPNTATLVVEGVDDGLVWYRDADGDGFGDDADTLSQVDRPEGYVDQGGDLDDADADVFPGAPEINDGKDNDGDGETDEDNAAPVASGEARSVPETGVLVIGAAELLGNDTDADGDALSVTAVGGAQGGTVELVGGVVTFTPTGGPGEASFAYTVSDGFGGEATATVTVEVTDAPDEVETPLALGQGTVSSYGPDIGSSGQDRTGAEGAEVSGSDVTLRGNAWKGIVLPEALTIAEGAELRFDYTSQSISEIVGIGFDGNALGDDGSALFQIAGTQTFGSADQTYRSYGQAQAGTVQSFAIDLSALEGRTFDRLLAIHDQDRLPATSEGTFSNVRIVTPAGSAANAAPEAVDDAATVASGEVLVLSATDLVGDDTDADGDALSVVAVGAAQGGSVELVGGEVRFTPAGAGAASFEYTVSDGRGGVDVGTVSVTVTDGPAPASVPIDFSSAAIQSYGDQDTTPGAGFAVEDGGDAIRVTGNTWKRIALPEGAEVTEGTVLRFELTLLGSAGEILGIGLETDDDFRSPGDALFQLAGRQNFGGQASRSEFGQAGAVGETVSYEIELGAFAGTGFTHLVLIADDDRDAAVDARFSGVALVEPGGDTGGTGDGAAPAIFGGAIGDVVVAEDQPLELQLPITDADTAAGDLVFTYQGLPEFVQADGGVLTGTPGDADPGEYQVTVTAADPEGNSVTGSFTLTVENVNDAPEVVGELGDAGAVLGSGFTRALPQGVFVDVDGDALTYEAAGLPAGLAIDAATGTITGTPSVAGVFAVTVTASDGAASASTAFDLTVASGPPREEIVIEAEAFTGLAEGEFDARFASTASGSTVIELGANETGSVATDLGEAGLAPGAYDIAVRHYDESDGASTLRVLIDRGAGPELLSEFTLDQELPGQGNFLQAGNLTEVVVPGVDVPAGARLVLEATAQGGEFVRIDLVRFTPVDAAPDAAPAFDTPAAFAVDEGALAVGAVVATDPEGEAVSYAVAGGADAALFAIDAATGALSFAAAPDFEAPADAGADNVYDVVVEASDGTQSATQAIAVTVADVDEAANQAPEAAAVLPQPQGTVGEALDVDLAGLFTDPDGDALTLSLVDAAGSGLALQGGALVGTPTAAGAFDVIVEASDGVATTQAVLSVTVEDAPSGENPFGAVRPADDLDGDTTPNAADGDVDGDGVADADDPFAYDAGDGRLLAAGQSVALDFAIDGTPYENGLTGLLPSPTPGFDEETGGARVEGGRLIVPASNGDTGGSNNPEDDYQLGVKNRAFALEARVENPFQAGGAANFDQLGIHVGLDSTDFVKLVFGFAAGLVEFSAQTDDAEAKATGANQPLPAGLTLADFAAVDLTITASATSASQAAFTAQGTFLDAAGNPIAGAQDVPFGTLPVSGALSAALFDETQPVGAGVTQTQVGGPNAPFDAVYDSLKVTAQQPDDTGGTGDDNTGNNAPQNATEVFAAQNDLTTNENYSADAVGAAELRITAGSNNVELSNFGANSFQVENVGDKKISAFFIDVTEALYPDSVFDPDGAGGDDVAKAWAVNSAGGTGGFVDGSGLFLPGQDPLPNTTGTGQASNGGFKGALIKFDATQDGGFETGEVVGFSGDMDPNSIAGLTKGDVDTAAIESWDVGGISGHELIGSSFTVLFDDGTTATGDLISDLSASGSYTRATQGPSAGAPGLSVGGVQAGGTGTYGVTAPEVIVTGQPGQTVRVTLTKGLDPVGNTANGIDALVEARLDRYDFKASNNFDSQSFDVTIGSNGTFDASDLFDYVDAPANSKGGFQGDDVAPIGFTAAVIGQDGLPLSETTDPIYLTNQGGPVTGGDGGGDGGDAGGEAPDGHFELIGSGNGARFKIQIEDAGGTGGADPGGKWSYQTAPDAEGRQAGFQGDGYYLFGSDTSTSLNPPNQAELLEYTIFVPEAEVGTYSFRARVSRDDNGLPGDSQNDIWVNFKPAENPGFGDIEEFLTGLNGNEPEPVNNGFVKVFGGPQNGNWSNATLVDGVTPTGNNNGNFGLKLDIEEGGFYTVQIAGRSQGYHLDFFDLYKGGAPGTGASSSQFVTDDPTGGGETGGGETGGGETGGGEAGNTLTFAVKASSDDYEVDRGKAGSGDLEFGINGSLPQTVGIRFDDVTIPQGRTIERAFIRFEAEESEGTPVDLVIEIEDTENAATYADNDTPDDRVYATDDFLWSDVEAWTEGEAYETPNLAALIEQVIGDDGIQDGALAFRVNGTAANAGGRSAHSLDGNGDEPELVIVLADDNPI